MKGDSSSGAFSAADSSSEANGRENGNGQRLEDRQRSEEDLDWKIAPLGQHINTTDLLCLAIDLCGTCVDVSARKNGPQDSASHEKTSQTQKNEKPSTEGKFPIDASKGIVNGNYLTSGVSAVSSGSAGPGMVSFLTCGELLEQDTAIPGARAFLEKWIAEGAPSNSSNAEGTRSNAEGKAGKAEKNRRAIVYLSSRQAGAEGITQKWLSDHQFPPGEILLKPKTQTSTVQFKTDMLTDLRFCVFQSRSVGEMFLNAAQYIKAASKINFFFSRPHLCPSKFRRMPCKIFFKMGVWNAENARRRRDFVRKTLRFWNMSIRKRREKSPRRSGKL